MFVAAALLGLVLIVLGLVVTLSRIAKNAGPLSLEDHAHHTGIVYIPISRELAKALETWSKPIRIRVDVDPAAPIATLIFDKNLEEKDV